MIWVVHPGPQIRMLTFYPSRLQGSKRHRIPDPDPQHCRKYKKLTLVRSLTAAFSVQISLQNNSCLSVLKFSESKY
jgi:hypothetical protein